MKLLAVDPVTERYQMKKENIGFTDQMAAYHLHSLSHLQQSPPPYLRSAWILPGLILMISGDLAQSFDKADIKAVSVSVDGAAPLW